MSIIGIDLGTSNSAAAVLRGGHPVIIPSAESISIGGKVFPSYAALTADGQMPGGSARCGSGNRRTSPERIRPSRQSSGC